MPDTKQISFSCFEKALAADLEESNLTMQQFSCIMWPDRSPDAAYDVLINKLSPKRRPNFTIHEVLNAIIILKKSENCMRFISDYWEYNMPTRKDSKNDPIAEDAINKLDSNIEDLIDELHNQTAMRKKFREKINRVSAQ